MADGEKTLLLNQLQHIVPPGTKMWDTDIEFTVPRKRSPTLSQYVKRTLPWFGFGILCVFLGGLLMYSYKTRSFEDHYQVRQHHISHKDEYRRTSDEIVPKTSHVNKEESKSELLDVVKVVLENVGQEKETSTNNVRPKTLNWTIGTKDMVDDCENVTPDKVFADIDYALYGYDTLKGYPLAIGHDPGYTLPIFKADYSSTTTSGDCRYNVPKGLAVVPDISCVTSFSSHTVTTHNEFMSELGVSAGIEAGGWGLSFSMSASYKSMQSKIENEERVFIFSNAQCKYYFCKIETTDPPGFTDGFMRWVKKLDNSSKEMDVMEFFDTYGTHFPSETDFGARYTYQYSMTSKQLEEKKKEVVNVEMAAGYSGLFSINAKFGMDSSMEQMAQNFMKDIEIETFTVGAAPPAGGDAMEWASTVATDPVPVHYKLESIENLFTATYMSTLSIDYDKIYDAIVKYKHRYERYLKNKALYGDSRAREHNYVLIFNSTLANPAYHETGVTLSDCLDDCINDLSCNGIARQSTFCSFFYGQGQDKHLAAGSSGQSYTTYLIWRTGNETFRLDDTIFGGTAMREIGGLTQAKCEEECLVHERCFGITYTSGSCNLYQQFQIERLVSDTVAHSKSVIVSRSANAELILNFGL